MEEKILEALLRAPEVVPEIREFFSDELLAMPGQPQHHPLAVRQL